MFRSIFGVYADRLQLLIDNSLTRFAPIFWTRFFTWAPPQTTLNYTSVIGATRIEAAASVVNRDSQAPLRSRPGISKLFGEIPAMSEKFRLNQTDYFEYLALQNVPNFGAQRSQFLIDLIFNDVVKAGNAPHKRLDMMVLEAISTGQITIDVVNNPDGIIESIPIDLLMPTGNKINSSVTWANIAAKPFTVDFPTVMAYAVAHSMRFSRVLLTRSLFAKFIGITEVKDYLSNTAGKRNNNILPTLADVNTFNISQGWPPLEIIDEAIGVEKDGVITTVTPFSDNVASFVPAGPLGSMKNTLAVEQRVPAEHVSYATFNRVLISKWHTNDPWSELTKCELNAMPSFDRINEVMLLTAVH